MRHMRLHNGVNETFDCEDCEYQGNTLHALKRHTATKHEGVRFLCDKCEYQATTEWTLRRHTDTVHKD